MNISSLLGAVLGFTLQEINSSQDRKELRNAIRQRILAPNIYRLHNEQELKTVAKQMVQAAWGVNSTNILGALIISLAMSTLKAGKIELAIEVLRDHRDKLASLRVERHDDATVDFVKKDKSEAKDFVRDFLALM